MSSDLYLEIGGVAFSISLPSSALLRSLEERYGSYLTSRQDGWRIALSYDSSLTDADAPRIRHDGPVTHFRVMSHQGWLDLDRQRATISTPSDARIPSALERVMSYICMQELPRHHDGLLLHGAGIVARGEGHVFFGASGRGKSTVSRLSAGVGEVLTDENVIIRLRDGSAELLSTPFWGLSTPADQIRRVGHRSVPLYALYSLVHAPEFTLTRLSPAEAVMELLTSEKVATERPSSASAWLEVVERLMTVVPVYRLGFRPTTELWSFLGLRADGATNESGRQ